MADQGGVQKRTGKAALSGELADFLIELSSAFQKHSMYPPGHPALAPAANAVIVRLSSLLHDRSTLSIGVAREQLIIEGVATDSSHPLLRSLAERLHRHELGAISFADGVKPEEIADVLDLVSTEPERTGRPVGREPEEVLKGRPHVRLHPVRYDSLRLREGSGTRQRRQEVGTHLWVGLAQAALAAEEQATAGEVVYDAESVARAIDERSGEEAYDQVIIGYMLQIARDLKDADPFEANELRDRFSALISKLRPETLRRLLRMGGDVRQRRGFLRDASRGVAVDAVLELVQAAAREEQSDISRSMMRLLSKMARHAQAGEASVRSRADEALRDQVQTLLSGWQLENPNPSEYEHALARMTSGAPVVTLAASSASAPEPERVIQTSLEVDTAGESLWRSADSLVGRGRARRLVHFLDTLEDRAEPNDTARRVWDWLADPLVIRRLLEEEAPDFECIDRLLPRAGLHAADALLDRLESASTVSTRRKVFDRLVALGPGVAPLAVERIQNSADVPWYVLRNILALLGALPEVPADYSPAPLRRHDDPRVRVEALKLSLKLPGERDRAILDALSDDHDKAIALGAHEAENSCPSAAEPALIRVATDDELDSRVRAATVRALTRLGTNGALEALLRIATPRKRFFRTELPPESPAMLAALRGLARRWADEPRAREILKIARSSKSDRVRAVATAPADDDGGPSEGTGAGGAR